MAETNIGDLSIINIVMALANFLIAIVVTYIVYTVLNPIFSLEWTGTPGTAGKAVMQFGLYFTVFVVVFYGTYMKLFSPMDKDEKKTEDFTLLQKLMGRNK